MPALSQTEATELFRRPPQRWIEVPTGEVAHRRVGTGPDVLLVHGWPVSGATFRRLLPHLADHVTCHVVDLPGAGSARGRDDRPPSVAGHVQAVRTVVDALGLESYAVVGHDSGGLIARHAVAGDPRLRALGLVDTEQPGSLTWRFRSFLAARHLPGFAAGLAWALGRPRVRRHPLVLGGAFEDPSLLEGEFDELFLAPLRDDVAYRDRAVAVLRSFDVRLVRELADVHRRITVPVRLVWGGEDVFFPVQRAAEMVSTFEQADLVVVPGAGLFAHEERPAEVAQALLPVLTGRA